jgi:hypothetical protein
VESVDDLLVFVAVDGTGRAWPGLPGAVLTRACAQGLVGRDQSVTAAVLDPRAVLDALDAEGRESQDEAAAIRALARVAESRGATLRSRGTDPTPGSPAGDHDYSSADVRAALVIISDQLRSTIEYAAHRLSAVVDETGGSLPETSRNVLSGRLCFIGGPTTGPTVGVRAREGPGT